MGRGRVLTKQRYFAIRLDRVLTDKRLAAADPALAVRRGALLVPGLR